MTQLVLEVARASRGPRQREEGQGDQEGLPHPFVVARDVPEAIAAKPRNGGEYAPPVLR